MNHDDIAGDPRWAVYMKAPIPECDEVFAEIVATSGREVSDVDARTVHREISACLWKKLRQLVTGRDDVVWDDVRKFRELDHRSLANFLSTQGAIGLAINDKLRSHLLYSIAPDLAERTAAGEFDQG